MQTAVKYVQQLLGVCSKGWLSSLEIMAPKNSPIFLGIDGTALKILFKDWFILSRKYKSTGLFAIM